MHPIKRYCEKYGMTQSDFAEWVGFTPGFISQLINYHEVCGRGAAMTISAKTKNEITIEELITWKPRQRARRTA